MLLVFLWVVDDEGGGGGGEGRGGHERGGREWCSVLTKTTTPPDSATSSENFSYLLREGLRPKVRLSKLGSRSSSLRSRTVFHTSVRPWGCES